MYKQGSGWLLKYPKELTFNYSPRKIVIQKESKMPAVTQNGQVTIPRQFRKFLNIEHGDQIEFETENNKVVVRKTQKTAQFRKYIGFLKNKKDNDAEK